MPYDFDRPVDRSGTDSLKCSEAVARRRQPLLPPGYLPMWVADMDFACPPEVLAAMRARLDRGILGYTEFGEPDYLRTVVGWMARRFGWTPDPDAIVFSPGVVPALDLLVELLTEPGDGVLLQPPVYGPFLRAIRRCGRVPVESPLRDLGGGRWEMDLEDLERRAADPRTTLFLLCSPHNPVGRVWTEEELRRAASICLGHGVRIVSDEIHADLTRIGVRHVPLPVLFPGDRRIVTCTAPSKTFNLAGNGLANVFVPDPDVRCRWAETRLDHPNPLSLAATRAAYTVCDAWLDELRAYLDGNFALLSRTLAERLPKAVFGVPEGTYLAWIDLRASGLPHAAILETVARAGLFLEGGDRYVSHGEGFVRLNAACPRGVLADALDRLARAFAPTLGG